MREKVVGLKQRQEKVITCQILVFINKYRNVICLYEKHNLKSTNINTDILYDC